MEGESAESDARDRWRSEGPLPAWPEKLMDGNSVLERRRGDGDAGGGGGNLP